MKLWTFLNFDEIYFEITTGDASIFRVRKETQVAYTNHIYLLGISPWVELRNAGKC